MNQSTTIVQAPAPAPQSSAGEPEHIVQFYDDDSALLDSLTDFVGAGLAASALCLIVATAEHRRGLEARLVAAGYRLDHAQASGRYVTLDAAEAVARILDDDGVPDQERFERAIGDVISGAGPGRPVRVFGEMVGLLLTADHAAATVRLEDLWNRLRERHPFELLCGYPMRKLGRSGLAHAVSEVCARHSRVVPAGSYPPQGDAEERVRAIVVLQQQAASLEAEMAERRAAEAALRAMKEELELQVADLRRARAEAETANRMKDEFLATVSHELRTPLNAILGWAHILRGARPDEATVTRAGEVIERNAHSQAQLIEDILDASRIITGNLRLRVGPVDLATVIAAATESVRLSAEAKHIAMVVTTDPAARQVRGDASRLRQMVGNLLANAIKFTHPGGRVEVRLSRDDQRAEIRVTDTGAGIAPEFLPFIFDRFRQADATITRRHGGLGLGLAIVRHLAELHDGTVHAESAGEGYGATFMIRLPLPDGVPPAHVPAPARAESSTSPLAGVQAVVVDDDTDALDMLAFVLTEAGATVRTASSAAEALDLLRWIRPDVLVSDLAMPDEDGYSLARNLRALERDGGRRTPAVALTAYVRIQDRARALAAGFDLFVEKPVDPEELISVIASIAERPAAKFARALRERPDTRLP